MLNITCVEGIHGMQGSFACFFFLNLFKVTIVPELETLNFWQCELLPHRCCETRCCAVRNASSVRGHCWLPCLGGEANCV